MVDWYNIVLSNTSYCITESYLLLSPSLPQNPEFLTDTTAAERLKDFRLR